MTPTENVLDRESMSRIAVVAYSSCAASTRGHRQIAAHVRCAAMEAGCGWVSPLPCWDVIGLGNACDHLRSTGLYDRIIIVFDFPDVPVSEQLTDCLASQRTQKVCPAVSMYIAMKASAYYCDLYHKWGFRPIAYDVVVAVEPGACRHVQREAQAPASCSEADFKISPLVANLAPLSEPEFEMFFDLVEHLNLKDPILWMKSGTPDEEERVGAWLRSNRSLEHRLLTSTQIEVYAREKGLSSYGVVRYSQLAHAVIAAPGYSTFWELYALDSHRSVIRWLKLDRPVEDTDGRIRLLTKPDQLERSSASALRKQPNAGVLALSRVIIHTSRMSIQ